MARVLAWLVAAMLASVAIAASSGGAEGDAKLSCEADIFVENEQVRIWFHGQKGDIKVFHQEPGDPIDAIYSYSKSAIVELQGDEVVAEMDLLRALPTDSQCHVFERDDRTELLYHVHTAVTGPQGQHLGYAGATFLYVLDEEAKGAKFDLLLRGWPWSGNATELAFDFQVHAPFGIDTAQNGLGFRDRDGNRHGYMDWEDHAQVYYDDDRRERANVGAETEANDRNVSVRLRYGDVDPGHIKMDYDPWVGTGGYEIIEGQIYGADWLDRQIPYPLRPIYHQLVG